MTWGITLNRQYAMTHYYIGEMVIRPNLVTVAVRAAVKRKAPQPAMFYYYGEPDDRLKELFGYNIVPNEGEKDESK